ncbi:hypothetical protein JCM3775_005532 [Rhodotorula graminis]|uniref:Proteophosphoglycan ppg4 n=1 Tax=Rhodotorula graminis (strain WP1) TaxID=578459 RepID=A0A0P9GGP2_RHOGW|nr:uncharacterized protein RHOBADRAFT_56182 [Rhodotorula graminis WP1]KPV72050.1 hypothetical protein RHOBADRAFT_56182 [Rhodotorula graminis WP1]
MGILSLPDLTQGNPYARIYATFHAALSPTPTPGFATRLYVLWALAGYGIVISVVYLCTMNIEYRRREKRFWLWRLVMRPNGRYIVGNQHALFAILTFISCAVAIGYFYNLHQVVLVGRAQDESFLWRNLIWVPLILHAWISSWSNLQASVLSTQKATKRHLVCPLVANTLYSAGLVIILVPVIVLDVYSGLAWHRAWNFGLKLRALVLARMVSNPNDTPSEVEAVVMPLLDPFNDKLGFCIDLIQANHAVYAAVMVIIIAVNLGGLGLLFTLRGQIRFNTGRLTSQIRQSSSVHGIPVLSGMHGPSSARDTSSTSGTPPDSPTTSQPTSTGEPAPAQKSVVRQVVFARSGDRAADDGEKEGKQMSVAQLKDAANDKTPAGASQRQQAKQLLALKKIELDLLVFLSAIVIISTVFLSLALWLAINPISVYSKWRRMEVSFTLTIWMYLVGVDVALSFLLVNSVRHLVSPNSRLAHFIGCATSQADRDRVRGSISGLTTSDEFETGTMTGTMTGSRPARLGAEGVLDDLREEDEEERGVHVSIETHVVEEESPERTPATRTSAEWRV